MAEQTLSDRWLTTLRNAFSQLGTPPPSLAPKSPEYEARAREFGEIRAPGPLSEERLEEFIQELPGTGAITKAQALSELTEQGLKIMAAGGRENIAKTTTTVAKSLKTLLKDLAGLPEQTLEGIESVGYRLLPGRTAGMHYPGKGVTGSRLEFDPTKPVPGMLKHEVTHSVLSKAEEVFRGKMSPARRIMRQEALDLKKKLQEAGATSSRPTGESPFYDFMPTEIHAYHLQKLPGESTRKFGDYERIFWDNLNRAITFSRRAIKEHQISRKGTELKGYPWD